MAKQPSQSAGTDIKLNKKRVTEMYICKDILQIILGSLNEEKYSLQLKASIL